MLRSVAARLFGLPNSFPSHDSVAPSCYFGAAPELDAGSRRKKQCRYREGIYGEGHEFTGHKNVREESVIIV